jgi:hypothetical protein
MTDLIRHRSQPDSQPMDAQPSRFHPAVLAAISAAMLFGASTPFAKVLLRNTSSTLRGKSACRSSLTSSR